MCAASTVCVYSRDYLCVCEQQALSACVAGTVCVCVQQALCVYSRLGSIQQEL